MRTRFVFRTQSFMRMERFFKENYVNMQSLHHCLIFGRTSSSIYGVCYYLMVLET